MQTTLRVWSKVFMYILQVFLDEVNTSSCLGLFKEIIVDRTFDGVVCNINTAL